MSLVHSPIALQVTNKTEPFSFKNTCVVAAVKPLKAKCFSSNGSLKQLCIAVKKFYC